jgi:hypothetical protein
MKQAIQSSMFKSSMFRFLFIFTKNTTKWCPFSRRFFVSKAYIFACSQNVKKNEFPIKNILFFGKNISIGQMFAAGY